MSLSSPACVHVMNWAAYAIHMALLLLSKVDLTLFCFHSQRHIHAWKYRCISNILDCDIFCVRADCYIDVAAEPCKWSFLYSSIQQAPFFHYYIAEMWSTGLSIQRYNCNAISACSVCCACSVPTSFNPASNSSQITTKIVQYQNHIHLGALHPTFQYLQASFSPYVDPEISRANMLSALDLQK